MAMSRLMDRRRIRPSGQRPLSGAVANEPTGLAFGACLRRAYTLWAPFYDAAVAAAFARSRRESLAAMGDVSGQRVLLVGVGTGLDIPWLRPGAMYVGLDLTPAMLRRARAKSLRYGIPTTLAVGDAMTLPFRESAFDRAVLHLILAVVPNPIVTLREVIRVLRPGGTIHVFDKFLHPGQHAPLRRLLSPLLGCLATRTDVVFEEVLSACPGIQVVSDDPDLARGWFRRIVLRRPR